MGTRLTCSPSQPLRDSGGLYQQAEELTHPPPPPQPPDTAKLHTPLAPWNNRSCPLKSNSAKGLPVAQVWGCTPPWHRLWWAIPGGGSRSLYPHLPGHLRQQMLL